MKKKLYWKFLFAYILIGLACFLMISTLGSRMIQREVLENVSTTLYKEATSIAENQAAQYYTSDLTLSDTYDSLKPLSVYQNSEIWMVSTTGQVFLNTAHNFSSYKIVELENFDPVALGSEYYSVGDFFGYFEHDMLTVLNPITANLDLRGYVAVHISMDDIYSQREHILACVYILFLLFYALFFLLLLLFSFTVYTPLTKIIHGAKEFTAGNLTHKIPVNSHDEMGYLATTLNYMADELNKSGEYQRKFVANISHDFRSPLTSIKGYVEAISDGTIPPEMQNKYLQIVVFETERLNKLTQSLLTLNSMEQKGQLLDITTFDINAVIKNTAAAFEGTCRSKHITIELLLASQTLFVSADMGKIQQVLYNLIDNALKFSDKDSVLYVETTERHGKVFISVKDTGIGIPRDSITKIWERFYKIDSSRGKDRKGTGLGLSIVKEIISAHNQNINVISTEGVGTEFIFTLDKSKDPFL